MCTIDSLAIITKILENGGQYPGDPVCSSVWAYWTTMGRKTTFKVYYEGEQLRESQFVVKPTLLWDLFTGFTEEGLAFKENPGQYRIPGMPE